MPPLILADRTRPMTAAARVTAWRLPAMGKQARLIKRLKASPRAKP